VIRRLDSLPGEPYVEKTRRGIFARSLLPPSAQCLGSQEKNRCTQDFGVIGTRGVTRQKPAVYPGSVQAGAVVAMAGTARGTVTPNKAIPNTATHGAGDPSGLLHPATKAEVLACADRYAFWRTSWNSAMSR
jgi:hypothetical protein